MVSFTLHLFLLLPYFFVTVTISSAASSADNILFNCGAPEKTTSKDGRKWEIDSPETSNTSTLTSASSQPSPSVEPVPYSTARISTSSFTYKIPVSAAGQKFLRLYFYPTTYSQSLDMNNSFFSVHTANHSLLSNFSVSLNLQKDFVTLVKEYIITVDESRSLEVTFTPNPNSFAFVNGIEVVSIPDKLYSGGNDDSEHVIKFLGNKNGFPIDDSIALENLYRLNVGETGDISSTDDTGMFRSWDIDKPYLRGSIGLIPTLKIPINYTAATPPYTAPEIVYYSARTTGNESFALNLNWTFTVDSGFYYLLRLHFCEFQREIIDSNKRVFSIFIHNQTAEEKADVYYWSGGRGVPVYKDYVVFVSDNLDGSNSKSDLWLAMRPNLEDNPCYESAILNGLEIFKLSKSGTLASRNPEPVTSPPPDTEKPQGMNKKGGVSHFTILSACIGGSLGVIVMVLLIVGFLLFRRRRENSQEVDTKSMWHSLTHAKSRSNNTNNSSLPSVRSRKFSLKELKHATSNFDDNFVIGAGGFGNVYKGYLDNGTYPVAIKRLNQSSRQGANEFQTEIRMLSNLRHVHLVPLIGYCNDGDEMILVYEYMVNGTLRSHLYRGDNSPLSWKQRLKICIGAARGLHYLHEGAERVIMHRDVKSTNILLDEKMNAKVSDFGLSKMGPSDASVTHVSTIVKGTMGYLDPEYYRRHQLTTKSDVYSFGVVMFEVLCARPVIMQQVPKEQVSLAEWARNCYRKGSLSEIVDKNLMGEIAVESLNKFGELACGCLRNQGIDRPSMSDVVWSLEFALQLQEAYEDLDKKMHPSSGDPTVNLVSGAGDDFAKDDDDFFSTTIVAKASETSTTSTSSDQMKSGSVFSEILNPNAR
ncbi:hypothetical protein ACET3Z_026638 [Daucus carota]